MPTFDAHTNFGYSKVVTAPTPAISGTSLTVTTGTGALFPAAPFNCTVWPASVNPLSTNAEIVRVTAVVGDVLTIVRAQESSTAVAIKVGYQIANTTSVKVFTDIENAINALPSFSIQSISAGTQVATGPQIVFANSNNITFGMSDNSQITASFSANGGAAISGGANSQNTGTVAFSNSNGVTFGLDGAGVMTASHNGLTSQSNQAFSAQGGSSAFQTLNFANSNGLTFSNSNGSVIASYTVPTQSTQPVAASASNGSFLFSTLGFSNGNGVTFGTSAGSIISASVAAGVAAGSISAGASSIALGQVVFSNSNNVSFGLNGSTVTASATAASSQGSINFSGGTASGNLSNIVFADGNGVSFGLNGSTMTASVSPTAQTTQPVAASASNGSFLFSTLGFSNANGVTFGTSAGSIVTASVNAAAAGSVSFSAGTSSANIGSLVFSNANGISFGLSGSTITATAAAAAAPPLSFWEPSPWAGTDGTFQAIGFSSIYFNHFALPADITMTQIRQLASFGGQMTSINGVSTGSNLFTNAIGFYSRSVTDSAATNFSASTNFASFTSFNWTVKVTYSISSSSISMSGEYGNGTTTSGWSSSTNTNAFQPVALNGRYVMSMLAQTSLSKGEYLVGQLMLSSTAGINYSGAFGATPMLLSVTSGSWAPAYAIAPNASVCAIPLIGHFSTSTNAFPASIAPANLIGTRGYRVYLQFIC